MNHQPTDAELRQHLKLARERFRRAEAENRAAAFQYDAAHMRRDIAQAMVDGRLPRDFYQIISGRKS